jgi:hypothetical protein
MQINRVKNLVMMKERRACRRKKEKQKYREVRD